MPGKPVHLRLAVVPCLEHARHAPCPHHVVLLWFRHDGLTQAARGESPLHSTVAASRVPPQLLRNTQGETVSRYVERFTNICFASAGDRW